MQKLQKEMQKELFLLQIMFKASQSQVSQLIHQKLSKPMFKSQVIHQKHKLQDLSKPMFKSHQKCTHLHSNQSLASGVQWGSQHFSLIISLIIFCVHHTRLGWKLPLAMEF
eukprot:TRINITY_DN1496_c1_g1_i5.p2 TRINITY_DN1496_c1_g1~~TRINITY_DN1496_c1_g1_i5.p2  ORF type:complete len:111 (-),score=18.00 TRINITY_DN1496_c1_g1_i5:263-595(-)